MKYKGEAIMVEDALLDELRALRDTVPGITGTAVASLDGLIVREDTGGVSPDNLAALAATWLSLAQRLSVEVGHGALGEATARSGGGSVTIYAIAGRAVLVLIGDERLDTSRLRRESQPALDAIGALIMSESPHAQVRLARG
jgi:predicted regulator of Ras-like GTPase activity (Roadblock/LC7/MglB family)